MSTHAKWLNLFLSSLVGIIFLSNQNASAAGGVTLYTPYTEISVPPGESINYSIDVINKSSEVRNVNISITGMPRDWDYSMKSGGWDIKKISILPGEKKTLTLKVNVPLKINKGTYRFKIEAPGLSSLPLVVIVTKQGTFKTEFTTNQANMEGNSKSTFTFSASLKNRTADKQLYALRSEAPRGWEVTFKANYKDVTSVDIDPNGSSNITISIKPPEEVKAGTYKIPVSASTDATSANLELEAVITGTYKMELTTPTGLISTDITAGKEKRVKLLVRNTGSAELKDINLSFSAPVKWDVTFDPKKIDQLQSGVSTNVFATIKASKKAIPGDYETKLFAKTPETSSDVTFRISVETPMLWGWVGVLIILIAVGSIYYLFRKYGRR